MTAAPACQQKRCGRPAHVGDPLLPVTEFYVDPHQKSGYSSWCKACRRTMSQVGRIKPRYPKAPESGPRLVHRAEDHLGPRRTESATERELDALDAVPGDAMREYHSHGLTVGEWLEVERFTDKAALLILAGLPWAEAWRIANEET